MDREKGGGIQYIQLVKVLYCKQLTNRKQSELSHLRLGWLMGPDLRVRKRVLSLCHCSPQKIRLKH